MDLLSSYGENCANLTLKILQLLMRDWTRSWQLFHWCSPWFLDGPNIFLQTSPKIMTQKFFLHVFEILGWTRNKIISSQFWDGPDPKVIFFKISGWTQLLKNGDKSCRDKLRFQLLYSFLLIFCGQVLWRQVPIIYGPPLVYDKQGWFLSPGLRKFKWRYKAETSFLPLKWSEDIHVEVKAKVIGITTIGTRIS